MKNLFDNGKQFFAEFNGKKVEYTENKTHILIEKSQIENREKIDGIVTYAHYCPSNPSNQKWQVEYRKPFARAIGVKPLIKRYKTREEAEQKIKTIDKTIKPTTL
jgi:molecular chaperone DnaK (HSP70)